MTPQDPVEAIRGRHRTDVQVCGLSAPCCLDNADIATLLSRIDKLTAERDAARTELFVAHAKILETCREATGEIAAANERAEKVTMRERERCVTAAGILCEEYVSAYEDQESDAVEQYNDFTDTLIQIIRTGTCESGATDYEKKIADALSRNKPQQPSTLTRRQ